MRRRKFVLMLASAAMSQGFMPLEAVARSASSYQVGDTLVTLNVLASGVGKITYFAPHEDETTSIKVAKAAVKKNGGRLFWLSHGGGRNISFAFEGKEFAVDPNRIFSNRGAASSIKTLSGYKEEDELPTGVVREVRLFADAVLEQLFSNVGLIVGMHNNTNNNYTAASYQGSLAEAAEEVFVVEGSDPDDFFFTTNRSIFEALKSQGFNAVLQKRGIADDGSLSVRCQRNGLPYVNIEAQDGHESAQTKMLDALLSI